MTGDAQKFSHISVASDDEDDVVIEAGAPHARAQAAPQEREASQAVAARPVEEPSRAEAVGATVAARPSAIAPEAQARPDDSPKPAAARPNATRVAGKASKQEYKETTLDDLEGTKMSGMQKGIIAVAAVGIVAFVVYYIGFMG